MVDQQGTRDHLHVHGSHLTYHGPVVESEYGILEGGESAQVLERDGRSAATHAHASSAHPHRRHTTAAHATPGRGRATRTAVASVRGFGGLGCLVPLRCLLPSRSPHGSSLKRYLRLVLNKLTVRNASLVSTCASVPRFPRRPAPIPQSLGALR